MYELLSDNNYSLVIKHFKYILNNVIIFHPTFDFYFAYLMENFILRFRLLIMTWIRCVNTQDPRYIPLYTEQPHENRLAHVKEFENIDPLTKRLQFSGYNLKCMV